MNQLIVKENRIIIKKRYEIVAFDKSELLYIKADGNSCEVYLFQKGVIKIDRGLKAMKNLLVACPNIIEVHRSYFVNLEMAVKVVLGCRPFVELYGMIQVPIAKAKKSFVAKRFEDVAF